MKTSAPFSSSSVITSNRGSVLVTALVFSAALAVSIGSYLLLSTNSLKLAHRTFLADSSVNLAETGLEEAVWMFNKMGDSSDKAANTALWRAKGWSCNTTVANIHMTSTGTNYSLAPTVTISGGGGTGATAVANLMTVYTGPTTTDTRVASITVTNQGSGYTSAPTVALSGGGGTRAAAEACLSATRTLTFNNLGDGGATGAVKVWVAGYDGSAVLPIIVAKASVTPFGRAPVEKMVKVILSKNGILPKGVVAFNGINWNGHPLADSYLSTTSTTVPPSPPYVLYDDSIARSNTTIASLGGTIDLARGSVDGNVLTGPGVTVVGHGDVSGQTIGNFAFPFTMPTAPPATYTNLPTVPASLPRMTSTTDPITHAVTLTPSDPATVIDGKSYYCYTVSNATIGALTVTAGYNIIVEGDALGQTSQMVSGLVLQVDGTNVATAKIFMNGPVTLSGNDQINATGTLNGAGVLEYNWAGSLEVNTTTSSNCTFSGNSKFYGCLTAPNARLVGNGSGNDMADLCGSFVVGSVTSNGHMNFHYDEALGRLNPPKAWGLALWKELQSTSDRELYTPSLNF